MYAWSTLYSSRVQPKKLHISRLILMELFSAIKNWWLGLIIRDRDGDHIGSGPGHIAVVAEPTHAKAPAVR
jgi:hypothetical protein